MFLPGTLVLPRLPASIPLPAARVRSSIPPSRMIPLPRLNHPLVVPVVLGAVGACCWWALTHRPPGTLEKNARGSPRMILASLAGEAGTGQAATCAYWRIYVRYDAGVRPPGSDWVVHEGSDTGQGYELHWLPQSLALQLHRGGTRAQLLGAVRLAGMPAEIAFQRRGQRLEVLADGRQVLAVFDAAPAIEARDGDAYAVAAPSAWGFRTRASRDECTVSLHLDRHLAAGAASTGRTAAGQGLDDRSRIATDRLRAALALDAETALERKLAAIGSAGIAVRALGSGQPDHPRFRQWLALAEAQAAIARAAQRSGPEGSAAVALQRRGERAAPGLAAFAVESLIITCRADPLPESPGIILALLDPLTERATARPDWQRDPKSVLATRREWLGLVLLVAEAARDLLAEPAAEGLHRQLGLIAHAVRQDLRREPIALPADAPAWLSTRWRAFSGGNPGVESFPPIPAEPVFVADAAIRDPAVAALARLVRAADLEPAVAVAMCAQVRAIIASESSEPAGLKKALAWLDNPVLTEPGQAVETPLNLPPRQALLTRALIVLREQAVLSAIGLSENRVRVEQQAIDDLLKLNIRAETNAAAAASVFTDLIRDRNEPLAFALAVQLARRFPNLVEDTSDRVSAAAPPRPGPSPSATRLPEPPPLYQALLNGAPESIELIWDGNSAQLLAAALAMQGDPLLAERGGSARTAISRWLGEKGDEAGDSRSGAGAPAAKPEAQTPWQLLLEFPRFSLPLDLLVPPGPDDRRGGEDRGGIPVP